MVTKEGGVVGSIDWLGLGREYLVNVLRPVSAIVLSGFVRVWSLA